MLKWVIQYANSIPGENNCAKMPTYFLYIFKMTIISSEQPSDFLIQITYQDKTHSFLSCFLSVPFLFLLCHFQKKSFEFPNAWLNPPPLTPLPSSASDKAAGCLKPDLTHKRLNLLFVGHCHFKLSYCSLNTKHIRGGLFASNYPSVQIKI